jgi:hypothetical protein
VVARVSQDSLHLDVIALEEDEVEAVAESVAWAIGRLVEQADTDSGGPDGGETPAEARAADARAAGPQGDAAGAAGHRDGAAGEKPRR